MGRPRPARPFGGVRASPTVSEADLRSFWTPNEIGQSLVIPDALFTQLYDVQPFGDDWHDTVRLISLATGASVRLCRHDRRGMTVLGATGIESEASTAYAHRVWRRDPLLAALLPDPERPLTTLQTCSDLGSRRPAGFAHALYALVDRLRSGQVVLQLFRPEGAAPFDRRDRQILDRLIPHLARSMAIRRRLRAFGQQTAALSVWLRPDAPLPPHRLRRRGVRRSRPLGKSGARDR